MVVAALVGIFLGVIAANFLFVGSALTLIPWGIAALLIGYFSKGRREALLNGAVYGFILSFVFLLVGYTGTEPVITRTPFFALLALFGAACGAILSVVGYLAITRMRAT
jgi:hypothetical protein